MKIPPPYLTSPFNIYTVLICDVCGWVAVRIIPVKYFGMCEKCYDEINDKSKTDEGRELYTDKSEM